MRAHCTDAYLVRCLLYLLSWLHCSLHWLVLPLCAKCYLSI